MKSYIIGIAGELNSGKDTLASMINYIFAEGPTKANYTKFITSTVKFNLTHGDRIIHFADPMKDCLSIMYNIPREYFESREHKDDLWYVIKEQRFIGKEFYSGRYGNISITDLQTEPLDFWINWHTKTIAVIKLRTLMQYFGTEIGRKQLGNDLWTNSTIGKAATIAQARRVCIVPDVRFSNEAKTIRGNSLYGGLIYIKRNNDNQNKHDSETIDFECPIIVDNNNTKMGLFYQAVTIVNNIINNK